jgi:hypothetical protein
MKGSVTRRRHFPCGAPTGHPQADREQKRAEVFFTTEGDAAITVTVYVFYGKWEG